MLEGTYSSYLEKNIYKITNVLTYIIKESDNVSYNDKDYSIPFNLSLNIVGNSNLPFSKQMDLWKKGKWNNQVNLVVLKETPQLYLDLGLKDNPITVTSNKMDRIVNESGKQKDTYHNLGIKTVKQLPNAISNPLNIIESTTSKDSIVVVTELADKNNNLVVVSMLIDGKGHIEIFDVNNKIKNKSVLANVMTSAYGRNNYDNWIENNKNNIIYDKDDGIIKKRVNGQWVQFPNADNSSSNNISQFDDYVKL